MNDLLELLRSPTEPYGYQSQLACEAADTIESLRAQVNAEQLKAAILRTEVNELRRERAFNERLARDLAAAQAQIAQLREALVVSCKPVMDSYAGPARLVDFNIALAIPTDTAALDARLAQERERCAVECAKYALTFNTFRVSGSEPPL
jgi:citrate synthase